MILDLDKNEVDVLKDYLTKKTMRLDEEGLSDSRCYLAMMSILHKIYKAETTVTDKQIKLIDNICSSLELDKPIIHTKKEASEFISKYIEKYKSFCAVEYYNWENESLNG